LQPNEILQARKFFKRAIELDPEFAMPHTGLADLIVLEVIYFALRPLSDLQLAEEEAKIAIELDPRDANAHTSLARSLGNAGAFSLAFDHVNRALSINPDSVDALRMKGKCLFIIITALRGANCSQELYEVTRSISLLHTPIAS